MPIESKRQTCQQIKVNHMQGHFVSSYKKQQPSGRYYYLKNYRKLTLHIPKNQALKSTQEYHAPAKFDLNVYFYNCGINLF